MKEKSEKNVHEGEKLLLELCQSQKKCLPNVQSLTKYRCFIQFIMNLENISLDFSSNEVFKICNVTELLINYNTDTGLDVVFDLFTGRVYTITSNCTLNRVRKTPESSSSLKIILSLT